MLVIQQQYVYFKENEELSNSRFFFQNLDFWVEFSHFT